MKLKFGEERRGASAEEFGRLLQKLDALISAGEGDGIEADRLREEMDVYYPDLSREEIAYFESLPETHHQKEDRTHRTSRFEVLARPIWFVVIGVIVGFVAKAAMHSPLTVLQTIVLGIIGSVVGGYVSHMFARAKEDAWFRLGDLIFPAVGAIVLLFVWQALSGHISTG
jgi:uncharacterized membrane protein YeaQ/YmgE (transglycosylase-associated protein family)